MVAVRILIPAAALALVGLAAAAPSGLACGWIHEFEAGPASGRLGCAWEFCIDDGQTRRCENPF